MHLFFREKKTSFIINKSCGRLFCIVVFLPLGTTLDERFMNTANAYKQA